MFRQTCQKKQSLAEHLFLLSNKSMFDKRYFFTIIHYIPLPSIANLIFSQKNLMYRALVRKMFIFAYELGEKSQLGKEGIPIVPNYEIANF